MPAEMVAAIDEVAKRTDRTRPAQVRYFVRRGLEAEKGRAEKAKGEG
jgi:hypothetical protein